MVRIIVRIIVRIMRKNYIELWNYETMGVIELQSYRTIELQNYRTIEDIIKELWRVRSQELGVVKELLIERYRELSKESLGRLV